MRILITCDRYPSPRYEGLVLRIYHYVRHLSVRHQFDMVCFVQPGQERDPEVERLFGRLLTIPFPVRSPKSGLARLRGSFDPMALYPSSDEARSCIGTVIREGCYDIIWDAGCNMLMNLIEARKTIPILADQVDDIFLGLRRQIAISSGLRNRAWLYKQLHLQKIFGRRFLATAEAVLFVSSLDEKSFSSVFPEAATITIANGVDEVFFSPSSRTPAGFNGRPEVVFEGVMCFGPNVDAAQYLAREIFPLVRKEVPDAHLSLVGRDPAPEVQVLASDDVEVTGFVDDVRPWLENAHVFGCAMRSGAGIKNKILQAWAMGKAVVSTPEGAFGLSVEDGKNIILRSSPKLFSEAVVELMKDPDRRMSLGDEGRRTVEENYSWTAKALDLEALLERIVKG